MNNKIGILRKPFNTILLVDPMRMIMWLVNWTNSNTIRFYGQNRKINFNFLLIFQYLFIYTHQSTPNWVTHNICSIACVLFAKNILPTNFFHFNSDYVLFGRLKMVTLKRPNIESTSFELRLFNFFLFCFSNNTQNDGSSSIVAFEFPSVFMSVPLPAFFRIIFFVGMVSIVATFLPVTGVLGAV